VTEVEWTTHRTGEAGTLTFTILKAGDVSFVEGDIVRLSEDGNLQFFGWVFTKVKNRWGEIDVTCYDRLRYLKANASYCFYSMSVGDIVKQIAGDLQIETSSIANTGYKIPSMIEEDQSCFDIIQGALWDTLLNTGKIYVLFDNGDGLSLQEAGQMKSEYALGENSLVTDYEYKTDIDEQTYNSVKLARPNEETGRTDVFVEMDSNNIARWGLLQLYQTVDKDLNDAQIIAQAKASLTYYNRRLRTITMSAVGLPGLRAGQMVLLNIPDLGDVAINQYVLLERVSHKWENDVHTMELETMAI
jgi:hypothetical protein